MLKLVKSSTSFHVLHYLLSYVHPAKRPQNRQLRLERNETGKMMLMEFVATFGKLGEAVLYRVPVCEAASAFRIRCEKAGSRTTCRRRTGSRDCSCCRRHRHLREVLVPLGV